MSYQIFISHSSKDKELARDLRRRLKEAGVRVSSDAADSSDREKLDRAVGRALREADEVILLLTDNVVANSRVIYEFGIAEALDKRVTPVVVTEGIELRLPMIGSHFVRYGDLPRYISSLKRRAKAA